MFDPQMALLSRVLAQAAAELATDAANAEAWARVQGALDACPEKDAELAGIAAAKDAAQLRALAADWSSGKRHLPEHDRELLKRALKAFRKSLKVTRLDAESSIGGGPMSSGRRSRIAGITPPPRYPREVWDELVRQGRLAGGKHGIYELPPE